ncbi:AAA family ATPase [Thomasclavelia cocleata]|uniref:AAA family ATPase n=1 Tax=Thomasclavelia cocleata TaxID=69824 RepID=UPI0025A9D48D|nr:hypothetical protein [Thomasclavelia cocleata]
MKIHLLKNFKPLCYNLDKWNMIQSPLLLVTGLSGSGKTTFAQKFAKHHHAICISFDVLKFYNESPKQSQKLLDIFMKKYPAIEKKVFNQWSKSDKINTNDILYNYYCNVFFDFLMDYSKQHNIKIVLEGIQIFVRLHPSKSVGLPIIIIRSSSINCFLKKLKRDYITKFSIFKINLIRCLIHDAYMYHIKQKEDINKYITYLSIIHNI